MGSDKSYWYLDLINLLLLVLIFFFGGAVISSQIILNEEMVYVPDLAGKTLDQARQELQKRDLGLTVSSYQFSEELGRGRIISQDPAPGSRLKVNRQIAVVVSSGSEAVAVPLYAGKSLEQATLDMRQKGLSRGPISQIHSRRYPAGRIIAQNPPAHTVVERNHPVGFLASQGEPETRYMMPDLIGRKLDRVAGWLQNAGFKIEDIRHVYYPGLEKGVIVRQNPPGGYPIHKRNPISLEVSR
ncbi:MAG: PASTA domain-containing protein [Candidatus Saccharicenans sp.]|jgi:serine/threonine-protein kinase|nr:PASTA domain-containing protein [Candidatus Saccharicenans sp.]MDH7493969.1 PASTA domain-containing protein [Candidatus Saccharicenans sp.]